MWYFRMMYLKNSFQQTLVLIQVTSVVVEQYFYSISQFQQMKQRHSAKCSANRTNQTGLSSLLGQYHQNCFLFVAYIFHQSAIKLLCDRTLKTNYLKTNNNTIKLCTHVIWVSYGFSLVFLNLTLHWNVLLSKLVVPLYFNKTICIQTVLLKKKMEKYLYFSYVLVHRT